MTHSLWTLTWALAALTACGQATGGGSPDAAPTCADGLVRCEGDELQTCVGGDWTVTDTCEFGCDPGFGCALCEPGTGSCSGEVASLCRPDGTGWDEVHCDPLQGLACDVDTGLCEGACAVQNIGKSYVGCEYFPTVTANEVGMDFEFAVVISNASSEPASVHIEGGALTEPRAFTVDPDSVRVERLPWQETLKACTESGGPPQVGSSVVTRGAYHLRLTQPITVYQYNPLDYTLTGGCSDTWNDVCSYTNDASLLLPATAMTGDYLVASWPSWQFYTDYFPGLLAVTATEDDTRVDVYTTAQVRSGPGVVGTCTDDRCSYALNEGDVVQLFTEGADDDFTGTSITADKPVQVIGGHYCTDIVDHACDHLEESMLPVQALGARYILTAPYVTPHTDPEGGAQEIAQRIVRIIATEPNTSIAFDPPEFIHEGFEPATNVIENAGEFLELGHEWFRGSVQIEASAKVLVAEYMIGGFSHDYVGDPALSVGVPVEQYRADYMFHAPLSYDVSYVNVVAPPGAQIFLDGSATPLEGFEPIGTTGFGLLRVPLGPGAEGNHRITGTEAFGITVYGYGEHTSYWYPGGLDLQPIIVP